MPVCVPDPPINIDVGPLWWALSLVSGACVALGGVMCQRPTCPCPCPINIDQSGPCGGPQAWFRAPGVALGGVMW